MPFGYHRHGFGMGFGPGHAIVMVLFLALLVLIVVWVISGFSRRRHLHGRHRTDDASAGSSTRSGNEAERILEERFARGDIDAEEFKQRRDLLREHS
jgi:putative membrane protein